ncbi:MAG TPA: 5-methyltetrahydropteroyltriglutamate--homocysteine S-methyltransferase [Gammaproteobacteria bacterium]|nr:5-methyltetrahydropteroyltriglutamate--homocysteine S-methyltransferase [Gammaproteobacteria bacterium]
MAVIHNLGFPRIGKQRELKRTVESYWKGDISLADLEQTGKRLRLKHWQIQRDAGLDYIPVGDFSWYDQVLDMSVLLGVIPPRFKFPTDVKGNQIDRDTAFRVARGCAPSGQDAAASEMTKWFDTNYHYIVPEFQIDQQFRIASNDLFDQIDEAIAAGHNPRPVIIGPLTYLWLGKEVQGRSSKLELLDKLLPVYGEILQKIKSRGIDWVQIDEPILALDLPKPWQQAFESAYTRLQVPGLKILVATYFDALEDNTHLACHLPVDGLHIDLVRAAGQLVKVLDELPPYKVLSLGIIDGRNIWRTDLDAALAFIEPAIKRLGDRLWLAPSCSLLHSPVDLDNEQQLDSELKSWLSFAVQKLDELAVLGKAVNEGVDSVSDELAHSRQCLQSRRDSTRIHKQEVAAQLQALIPADAERGLPYRERTALQQSVLGLPLFPTTTIGSFPQTNEIRQYRRDYRRGRLDQNKYISYMRESITETILQQEQLGLDVLVHGEPERNDMVEYFAEFLQGFAFTENGWVQSYGSRCVKPPIIYGDVTRPEAMTIDWYQHAQAQTRKPVKGMLTGPVTILQWSFVRDDQPRRDTCLQLALAIRNEVADLDQAGARVIQIDEPALREGLPLRKSQWQAYLDWAVYAFRVSAAGAQPHTQIHTHMCYAEFNDIIEAIAALDADVLTLETSRSHMEPLQAFVNYKYPNALGPGVYDIHSPRIPETTDIVELLQTAMRYIPAKRLWVNPDCGLKTRGWPEVRAALQNMVQAADVLRKQELSVESA